MPILVMVHSLWRWLVLGAALLAILGPRVADGAEGRGWASRTGLIYTITFDIQILIGLLIWLLNAGWTAHPFYAYYHPIIMLVAVGVAHMGRKQQKRALANRQSGGAWAYLGSLLLLILGIPWFI